MKANFILEYFSKWFESNSELLAQSSATVELSCSSDLTQTATSIANIDFDGGALIGVITLYESGECEMEAFYAATGNWIWGETYLFDSENELGAAMRRFFIGLRKAEGGSETAAAQQIVGPERG
jgi:hypothetical protein